MNSHARGAGWTLLAAVWLMAGCNPVSVRDGNEAAYRVSSEPGVEVTVVTSTMFVLDEASVAPNFIESDTVTAQTPVEGDYDLRATGRFFVEILDSDPEGVPIRLQVWIDGSDASDHTASLTQGQLRYMFLTTNVR